MGQREWTVHCDTDWQLMGLREWTVHCDTDWQLMGLREWTVHCDTDWQLMGLREWTVHCDTDWTCCLATNIGTMILIACHVVQPLQTNNGCEADMLSSGCNIQSLPWLVGVNIRAGWWSPEWRDADPWSRDSHHCHLPVKPANTTIIMWLTPLPSTSEACKHNNNYVTHTAAIYQWSLQTQQYLPVKPANTTIIM